MRKIGSYQIILYGKKEYELLVGSSLSPERSRIMNKSCFMPHILLSRVSKLSKIRKGQGKRLIICKFESSLFE